MHFSQKRELFLFPITTLLPSLIVCFLFVISLSVRATRTVICSFIVRSFFVHCSFIVRSLFVLCSFFVRSLFVLCSFIVRLLFVFCSLIIYPPVWLTLSARAARTCSCGSHLLVWLALSLVIDLVFLALLALLVLN